MAFARIAALRTAARRASVPTANCAPLGCRALLSSARTHGSAAPLAAGPSGAARRRSETWEQPWGLARAFSTTAPSAAPTRTITMVMKRTPDGTQCRKCNDIEARLERDGLMEHIDHQIYMDLDDPSDFGTQLATKHDVKVAPFFVVQHANGEVDEVGDAVVDEDVYTVYLKMKKQVFGKRASKDEETVDVALSIF